MEWQWERKALEKKKKTITILRGKNENAGKQELVLFGMAQLWLPHPCKCPMVVIDDPWGSFSPNHSRNSEFWEKLEYLN